ncbi:aerotolerance regulator BatA [Longimonas halophila]|uniref:Aerotolerance regulator BatA n=1 Tax=Longimonas halophila TaxID=1469170 RepID=A0A2H3NZN8_9BACT|nr:VWA domain-containing protein [Longimonas halophila]PEN08463.1 aerotolerance regulator BatA [Longimonas halophila]
MTFAYPWVLWGLVALLLWAVWRWWQGPHEDGVAVPTLAGVPERVSWRVWVRRALPLVRGVALALIIVALARPQQHDVVQVDTTEGIDLVLALDASTSMRTADFPPNRFEAARSVAIDFVQGRPNDRMGLVVFAGRAFTQAPLTTDRAFLTDAIEALRLGQFERGTAIGAALATSVNRLRESEAPSRVVVLLTDGRNNRGSIDPLTAAEIARVLGIRVYTIGVGAFEDAPFEPEADPESDDEVDESTLTAMAERTGGQYFRASDTEALRTIYNEIAGMEQGEIETTTYTDVSERFAGFAGAALFLVLVHTLLRTTAARRVP